MIETKEFFGKTIKVTSDEIVTGLVAEAEDRANILLNKKGGICLTPYLEDYSKEKNLAESDVLQYLKTNKEQLYILIFAQCLIDSIVKEDVGDWSIQFDNFNISNTARKWNNIDIPSNKSIIAYSKSQDVKVNVNANVIFTIADNKNFLLSVIATYLINFENDVKGWSYIDDNNLHTYFMNVRENKIYNVELEEVTKVN